MRIVHYLNQFFAGIGGEDHAGIAPQVRRGSVGPGARLADLLGREHEIIATVICGDDYAASAPQAAEEIFALAREFHPRLLVAGPAFTSGRYGLACARVCSLAAREGVVAVASMNQDNPAVDDASPGVVVASGETARHMGVSLDTLAAAIRQVATGGALTAEHGRISKLPRRNFVAQANAANRAVDLVLARHSGDRTSTEVPLPKFGHVMPAAPIEDAASATIALLTEGALVPAGNPGRLESARATRWLRYEIAGKQSIEPGEFQSVHGGFSTVAANADPHRLLPLDVARQLEKEGKIGKLHSEYFVTVGNGMPVSVAQRFGVEWAAELRKVGVQAVILTSTWGTGTRCGSTLAKELERSGLPTALVCNLVSIAQKVGAPRIVAARGIPYPAGDPSLDTEDERAWRRRIVERALEAVSTAVDAPSVFEVI